MYKSVYIHGKSHHNPIQQSRKLLFQNHQDKATLQFLNKHVYKDLSFHKTGLWAVETKPEMFGQNVWFEELHRKWQAQASSIDGIRRI